MAARRLHVVRDARAVRDVRRRDRSGANAHARVRCVRREGGDGGVGGRHCSAPASESSTRGREWSVGGGVRRAAEELFWWTEGRGVRNVVSLTHSPGAAIFE